LPYCGTRSALSDFRPLILNALRSFLARRPARGLDGAIVTILTVLALFYCYEYEVLPADSKPHTLELDELLLVSTLFFGGLLLCALRRLLQREGETVPARTGLKGRPTKNAEIEAAIEALAATGIELPKLPRKDACVLIRQRAAELGASVEVGFSDTVIQRSLVRRYGPRI
jgi:hypothetical protein